MKKLIILTIAAMAMVTGYSTPTWAMLDTTGVNSETTPQFSNYSAYLCSATTAGGLFGGATEYNTITDYLAANYVDYSQGIGGMDAMSPYGFDAGKYTFDYSFRDGALDGLDGDRYIAIVAYLGDGGNQFRVFETQVNDGSLIFDPTLGVGVEAIGGMAGEWTAAAIPEPTSGLLLLFGLAGLALKRRASTFRIGC